MATASTAAVPLFARASGAEPATPRVGANPRAPAEVTLKINGQDHRLALDVRTSLLDALRDHVGLTGAKKGCDHGQCSTPRTNRRVPLATTFVRRQPVNFRFDPGALPQCGFQIGRPAVLAQQVTKRLVSQLLEIQHAVTTQQIERLPRFIVELNALSLHQQVTRQAPASRDAGCPLTLSTTAVSCNTRTPAGRWHGSNPNSAHG